MDVDLQHCSNSGKYIHIVNENSTEAVLYNIFTEMSYPFPSPLRSFESRIRIGHVVFCIFERRHWNTLDNSYSNGFIEWVVERVKMLEDGTVVLEEIHPLVGEWIWESGDVTLYPVYTFYSSGEGHRTHDEDWETESFEWVCNGDGELKLTIRDSESETQHVEIWNYEIRRNDIGERLLYLENLEDNMKSVYWIFE